MLALFDFANDWLRKGGLLVLAAIVFAESGLLIGFFLPGDSLLFIAGFLASRGGRPCPAGAAAVAAVASLAAIAGDQVGYLFGRKVGPRCSTGRRAGCSTRPTWPRRRGSSTSHGSKTIVLARFVPIVRTFAPIVAGVGKMHYRTFVTYNVIGGVLWGVGVTTLGYFLGKIEFIKNNLEIAAS